MKKVSIIIPVYNVERYIDRCINSVCNQTYKNIEIIIVYDHSEDATLEKCEVWSSNDNRLVVYKNNKRQGVGNARNYGIIKSTGDYIVHLDADDWVAPDYIACLLDALESTFSDIVAYTDATYVYKDYSKKRHWLPAGTYSTEIDKRLFLICDTPSLWRKMYRKSWLENNNLRFPIISNYDDWAYSIATVLCANKITLISGNKNYYSIRTDSLTSETKITDYEKGLIFGLGECQRLNLRDKNILAIMQYFLYHFQIQAIKNTACDVYGNIFDTIWTHFESNNKPTNMSTNIILFGSFSSWWVLMHGGMRRDIDYYGFSSLVSAMTHGENIADSNSQYRKRHIQRDAGGEFYETIKAVFEYSVLYIDFQNERYDLLFDGKNYYTMSEAVEETTIVENSVHSIIKTLSGESIQLWKEKCKALIQCLKNKKSLIKVVVLKQQLAECYGDLNGIRAFPELTNIRLINAKIEKEYQYFIDACERNGINIEVLNYDTIDEKYIFTDCEFEYGCEPQYLNHYAYGLLGEKLFLESLGDGCSKI